jgi:glycosyltransferase involved in cell wall biosynthesis
MRIVVHDFAGHPFQVQLSRALAARGHEVAHLFSSTFVTPKGALELRPGDPPTFRVEGIAVPGGIHRTNYVKRRQGEIEHGRLAVQKLEQIRPDLVICGNTGLDAVAQMQDWCASADCRFFFWVQDLIGRAAQRILREKMPVVGGFIGDSLNRFEQKLLKRSDGIVVISEDFRPHLPAGSGPISVIENWGVMDEIPVRSHDNAWSRQHGLAETTNLIYSGTLGRKHNPELLIKLAAEFNDRPDVRVVVITGDDMIGWLNEKAAAAKLNNFITMPFQPFEVLPDIFGAADVLTAILEPDAGVFSVPSKVLSYLCAGRAILLAVPLENLAAKIVLREEAGLAAAPGDNAAWLSGARELLADPDRCRQMGANGRAYAERAFDIEAITDQFEEAFGVSSSAARRTG